MLEDKMRIVSVAVGSIFLVFYSLWKIRLGLHWDEAGTIEGAIAILKGMNFVSENWEPLQLVNIVLTPLLELYRCIFGNLDGAILGIRYVYLFFQLLIAIYIYLSLKNDYGKSDAYIVSFMSFTYYFGWMSITYKSMLYMGGMVTIISLHNYLKSLKRRYLIFSAVASAYMVLGYPTTIIILPVFAVALYKLCCKENRKFSIIVYLVSVLVILGIIGFYIIFVQGDDFKSILNGIFGILGDESHSENIVNKMGRIIIPIVILGLVENTIANHFTKVIGKNRIIVIELTVILGIICILRIKTAGPSRFWYVLLGLYLLIPFLIKGIETKVYRMELYLYIIPSVFAILSVAIGTNQGIAVVAKGCVWGLMGLALVLRKTNSEYKDVGLFVAATMCFMFIFFVPDASDGSSNILWKREIISDGVAKGIYVQDKTKNDYNSICDVVRRYVGEGDKLLVISKNMVYAYMNTMAVEATFSPSFCFEPWSERCCTYYELNQGRIPNVIILDEDIVGDTDEYLENSSLGNFISSNYDVFNNEGKYWIFIEKG